MMATCHPHPQTSAATKPNENDMSELATEEVWRSRLDEISSSVECITLSDSDSQQDEEWCDVTVDGEESRIRFHDYDKVFGIAGLYEELFYDRLACCSPNYISRLLDDVVRENGDDPHEFRVLDVGAGNGMMGDELKELGVEAIVGVDIISSAKHATARDRPEVYDDYRVLDLTQIAEDDEEILRRAKFNCLTTVAALGFGDIPALAFAKALDLIETPGWLGLNLKEDFLRDEDTSGFSRLIRQLSNEGFLQVHCYRRYRHRLTTTGKPLFYVAMIAKKLRDLDDSVWEWLENTED